MPINKGSGEYEPTPEMGHRVIAETRIAKYLCVRCSYEATPEQMSKLDPRFGLVCPKCAPMMLEHLLSSIVMRPVTVAIPAETLAELEKPLEKKPIVDETKIDTRRWWNPKRR